MNKSVLSMLLVFSIASASFIYNVDTDRSGISSVTLSMQGNDTAYVPLPSDAADFRVVGGGYAIDNGTAAVTPGPSGFTTFSFTTSLFTTKTPTGWKLSFAPPKGASVLVYMPPYSMIDNPFPEPKSVSADSSRTLIQYDDPGPVTIFYSIGEQPAAQAQGDPTSFYIVATAVILAVAIIAASLILKLPGRQQPQKASPPDAASAAEVPAAQSAPPSPQAAPRAPSLELTGGKKEMMETFNENDLKIVNFLLSSGGRSRRNELERKTEISKSSLAMALNRLEKRKIIEIDRTATTHFVKLADYFLRL